MAAANEKDIGGLTRNVYEAYSSGNWSALENNLAGNASLVAMSLNKTYKGPTGVLEYFRNHKNAFALTLDVQRVASCEDTAVVEYIARGKHVGPYTLPTGEVVPPTGRNLDLPVCHIVQWKNDKISEIHTYFDLASLMAQIGIGMTEDIHRR